MLAASRSRTTTVLGKHGHRTPTARIKVARKVLTLPQSLFCVSFRDGGGGRSHRIACVMKARQHHHRLVCFLVGGAQLVTLGNEAHQR